MTMQNWWVYPSLWSSGSHRPILDGLRHDLGRSDGYPEFPFRFKEIRCVVCTHKGYSILSEFQKICLCMRILTNHTTSTIKKYSTIQTISLSFNVILMWHCLQTQQYCMSASKQKCIMNLWADPTQLRHQKWHWFYSRKRMEGNRS